MKQTLRSLSELAITAILGRTPRSGRRTAGRGLANEAYRQFQGLPRKNPKTNVNVVNWIVREYDSYIDKLSAASNPDPAADPPVDGAEPKAVAD